MGTDAACHACACGLVNNDWTHVHDEAEYERLMTAVAVLGPVIVTDDRIGHWVKCAVCGLADLEAYVIERINR